MKILLHICCAPCAITPVETLRGQGMDLMGFFYRHNIHPYTECQRRQQALETYADQIDLRVIYQEGYDLEGFLRNAAFREADRCRFCYHDRMRATALVAKRGKFDGFTSTLLYSKFQKHDQIRDIAQAVGKEVGIAFHYHDFRDGWKTGIETSKALGMYRQQYCGCIYSEKERYYKGG
ncbi:MAG: epoxyqueuosine reductase QueH [Desulfobacterales bacterium]|nr:epoxyqueuosine reductase QueH [Desulfobacterales bacterium]